MLLCIVKNVENKLTEMLPFARIAGSLVRLTFQTPRLRILHPNSLCLKTLHPNMLFPDTPHRKTPAFKSRHPKSPKKNSTIIIIAIVAIVAIIGATVGTVVHFKSGSSGGSSSYEKAVDNFINAAYREFDGDKVISLMNPEVISFLAEQNYFSERELKEEIKEILNDFHEDYPGKVRMSYEITSESVFDDEERVDDINEDFRDAGYSDIRISAYAIVEIELNYDDGYSEDDELMVVKIGKKWYVAASELIFDSI